MIALVLLGFLALSCAAPRYHDRHHDWHRGWHHDHDHHENFDFDSLERYMEQEMFNTRRFWEELRREMMGLDAMLTDFNKRFPTSVTNEKIEGDNYIVTITLGGFQDNEIVVKAKKGLLIVQAVHDVEGEPKRNYLDVRSLPDCVNELGSWTLDEGVLKIVFPLTKSEGTEAATEGFVTAGPDHSREDVVPNATDDNQDADVGAERGDLAPSSDVLTNEIPQRNTVEATTYAVDLKDEVELVPFHYK